MDVQCVASRLERAVYTCLELFAGASVQVTTNTKREQSLELTWNVMGLAKSKSVHNRNRMLMIIVWGCAETAAL